MALRIARTYRMSQRANAVAETERRILESAERLFLKLPCDQVRLEDVAAAAGVSAPTVIHRFGSKDALILAASRSAAERVRRQRGEAPVGDLHRAVANLVEHYEEWGDASMHLLSQEAAVPTIRKVSDEGRALHAAWVERAFAPWLGKQPRSRRRRLKAQLVALMDVYVWKILRRDRGLGRAETEAALLEMVSALLGAP